MSIKVMCFAALLAFTNNALASSEVNTEPLSYNALLSRYQYDFKVNYFSVESQKPSLKMAYIFLKPTKEKMPTVTLMPGTNLMLISGRLQRSTYNRFAEGINS
jgi:hypothetical protein